MKKWVIWAILAALLLAGCGEEAVLPDYAPAESEKLTICTSHKQEVWQPLVKEFENRTGIWVEVIEGGTNELLEQLESGTVTADLMFGGGVENLDSYTGLFTPYISCYDDDILPQYSSQGHYWTPFSSLPVVLIYNPKLLGPQAVTGWADLLRPDLAGKIAFADPGVSGSSYTALVTLLEALGGGQEETMRSFADALQGKQLSGSGEVLSAVASGEALVGITIEETALRRMEAGDALAMVYPREGTSCVPDGCAILENAAHPENARAFVDFTLCADVQQLLQTDFCRRSVRRDLAPAQGLLPLDSLTQVDYDVHWASENRDKLLMSWQFFFGAEETP